MKEPLKRKLGRMWGRLTILNRIVLILLIILVIVTIAFVSFKIVSTALHPSPRRPTPVSAQKDRAKASDSLDSTTTPPASVIIEGVGDKTEQTALYQSWMTILTKAAWTSKDKSFKLSATPTTLTETNTKTHNALPPTHYTLKTLSAQGDAKLKATIELAGQYAPVNLTITNGSDGFYHISSKAFIASATYSALLVDPNSAEAFQIESFEPTATATINYLALMPGITAAKAKSTLTSYIKSIYPTLDDVTWSGKVHYDPVQNQFVSLFTGQLNSKSIRAALVYNRATKTLTADDGGDF
ncbi:MAG: hypothetical protein FWF45_00645 [Coriobacteriia bacterium]|nr:hypothetical protein [Coriobacteriia bacterium]